MNVRTILTLAGVVLIGTAGLAVADKDCPHKGKVATTQPTGQSFTPELLKLGTLMHRQVKNPGDEMLGRIEDIVLNPDQSRVSYAVLAYGGVLGMGGKYFAIPWDSFEVNGATNTVTLNIDKARFENAKGFDKNNWPETGNQEWCIKGEGAAYHGEFSAREEAARGEGKIEGKTEFKVGTEGRTAYHREDAPFWARKVSGLIGMDVKNYQGEDLSSIENLYIDTRENRLVYGMLSFGGVLGIGEKNVVVPWSALEMRPQLHTARCDVAPKTLDALAFKQGDHPDLTNQEYARKIYTSFHQEPYWEVFGYVSEKKGTEARTLNLDVWKADSDYNRKFDAATVITVDGVIESVGTFRPAANSPEGLRLRIKTDQGRNISVHIGPTAFATAKGFEFHYGDKIAVTGSKTTYGANSILMATEVRVDGKDLKLRGVAGEPLWKVDLLYGRDAGGLDTGLETPGREEGREGY